MDWFLFCYPSVLRLLYECCCCDNLISCKVLTKSIYLYIHPSIRLFIKETFVCFVFAVMELLTCLLSSSKLKSGSGCNGSHSFVLSWVQLGAQKSETHCNRATVFPSNNSVRSVLLKVAGYQYPCLGETVYTVPYFIRIDPPIKNQRNKLFQGVDGPPVGHSHVVK